MLDGLFNYYTSILFYSMLYTGSSSKLVRLKHIFQPPIRLLSDTNYVRALKKEKKKRDKKEKKENKRKKKKRKKKTKERRRRKKERKWAKKQ